MRLVCMESAHKFYTWRVRGSLPIIRKYVNLRFRRPPQPGFALMHNQDLARSGSKRAQLQTDREELDVNRTSQVRPAHLRSSCPAYPITRNVVRPLFSSHHLPAVLDLQSLQPLAPRTPPHRPSLATRLGKEFMGSPIGERNRPGEGILIWSGLSRAHAGAGFSPPPEPERSLRSGAQVEAVVAGIGHVGGHFGGHVGGHVGEQQG